MEAVGYARAIAVDKEAQFAFTGFYAMIEHPWWYAEAFGNQFKMVDQRLHTYI